MALNGHFLQANDIFVRQDLEQFDFSKSRDGKLVTLAGDLV
jgi:hypothetical protein